MNDYRWINYRLRNSLPRDEQDRLGKIFEVNLICKLMDKYIDRAVGQSFFRNEDDGSGAN